MSKANIHNYFRNLAMDVDAAYLGFYFLEFCEYFCQENNDEKEMLKLLYQSLRALESPVLSNVLVRAVFELKAITINGEGPSVFSCMHCRGTDELFHFSIKRGGIFCKNCKSGQHTRTIHESTRYAMQYVVSSNIEKLFTFQLSEEVLEEFQKLIKAYIQEYVKHSFKSLQIIDELMLK